MIVIVGELHTICIFQSMLECPAVESERTFSKFKCINRVEENLQSTSR